MLPPELRDLVQFRPDSGLKDQEMFTPQPVLVVYTSTQRKVEYWGRAFMGDEKGICWANNPAELAAAVMGRLDQDLSPLDNVQIYGSPLAKSAEVASRMAPFQVIDKGEAANIQMMGMITEMLRWKNRLPPLLSCAVCDVAVHPRFNYEAEFKQPGMSLTKPEDAARVMQENLRVAAQSNDGINPAFSVIASVAMRKCTDIAGEVLPQWYGNVLWEGHLDVEFSRPLTNEEAYHYQRFLIWHRQQDPGYISGAFDMETMLFMKRQGFAPDLKIKFQDSHSSDTLTPCQEALIGSFYRGGITNAEDMLEALIHANGHQQDQIPKALLL